MALLDREDIKTFIKERNLKVMTKNDIQKFAECIAVSFKDYPLFEFFCNKKYSVKKMTNFWKVSLKMSNRKCLCLASDDDVNAVIILVPPKSKDPGVIKYLLNGGLRILFNFGFKGANRMLMFENYAGKIKSKYSDDKTWYINILCVKPEFRGQKLGGSLFKCSIELANFLNNSLYLETMKEINVKIYEKYGFELVETNQIKKTDFTMYSMVYHPQK